jgi:hypothetical protein|mmetsp:Transcript_7697/g.14782  ORF Transcript_7697/g.14782 Transcript_7697/m.14782 type:complete len:109 (+) Transcript_7697:383-709(+)
MHTQTQLNAISKSWQPGETADGQAGLSLVKEEQCWGRHALASRKKAWTVQRPLSANPRLLSANRQLLALTVNRCMDDGPQLCNIESHPATQPPGANNRVQGGTTTNGA